MSILEISTYVVHENPVALSLVNAAQKAHKKGEFQDAARLFIRAANTFGKKSPHVTKACREMAEASLKGESLYE